MTNNDTGATGRAQQRIEELAEEYIQKWWTKREHKGAARLGFKAGYTAAKAATPDSREEGKGALKNCLGYALRFWEKEPEYRLYYCSGHVINSHLPITVKSENSPTWLLVEDYGYNYFKSSFDGLLDEHETQLLKKYFNE